MARVLGAVALLLVLTSIAGQLVRYLTGHDEVYGLIGLVYVDNERNIPTLFSVLIFVFASQCCAVIAGLARKQKGPDFWKWVFLSFGFLYLGFDEGLSLHEKLSVPIRAFLGTGALGFRHTYWAIPGLAGVLVLGVFLLPFLRRLPARTRNMLLLGGAVFLGGAVGVEMFSGNYADAHGGVRNLGYSMIVSVEESMEMAGVIIAIYALLDYMARAYGVVLFRLDESKPPRPPGA